MKMGSLSKFVQADLEKLQKHLLSQGLGGVQAMDYQKYLRSTLWQKIREWILERDDKTCQVCAQKHWSPTRDGMEVHHRNYELDTLEGRDHLGLITLCRKCHERIEHSPDGAKRTSLIEKEAELVRLQELHRSIIAEGMALKIREKITAKKVRVTVEYVGPNQFLEFYALDSFALGVVIDFYAKHHEKLRLPLPFARHKLFKRSGANVISRETNKSVMNAKLEGGKVIFVQPADTIYPLHEHLLQYISKKQNWKLGDESHLRSE